MCYTGANWGKDYEVFAVTFPGTDADHGPVRDDQPASHQRCHLYTVAAPPFCFAEISRGYHDPGQPEPGPGPDREILNPAASAPFASR